MAESKRALYVQTAALSIGLIGSLTVASAIIGTKCVKVESFETVKGITNSCVKKERALGGLSD
jgi:hypothetical protein